MADSYVFMTGPRYALPAAGESLSRGARSRGAVMTVARCRGAVRLTLSLKVFLLFLLTGFSQAAAGALPLLQWDDRGRADWESGYVISYGSGAAPDDVTDLNLRRSMSLRSAHRKASRNLLRLCLGLRVQHSLTVRDYVRNDPDLQEELRRRLREIAPWEVRLEKGGRVQMALRIPLGGGGGLIELVGEVAAEEIPPREGSLPPAFSGGGEREHVTGIVLLASGGGIVPALRPRIRGNGGSVLLEYDSAPPEVRERPAFIPYYGSLEEAVADPLLGTEPIVAAAGSYGGSGTDVLLPPLVEDSLLATVEGRALLEEGRLVIVLQE